jgi:HEAT repeat protein
MKTLLLFSFAAACLSLVVVGDAQADSKKDDVAAYMKDLRSGSAKKRATAAKELGEIGAVNAADAKDAIPILLDLLKKDNDSGVRQATAAALGRMDPEPEKAVPVLTNALKDKKAGVRMAAATSLGQLGPEAKDAIPALRDLQQNDKDRGVTRAAGMAIRTIQGQKKK